MATISRRQFLQMCVAAGLWCNPSPLLAARPPHIAVLGGGLAGLLSAWRLSQAGCDVTVLEGRPQVGGRVQTASMDGLHVDLGAARISSKHRFVLQLAQMIGVPLDPFLPDRGKELFRVDGRVTDDPFRVLSLTAYEKKLHRQDPDDGLEDHFLLPVVNRIQDPLHPDAQMLKELDALSYPRYLAKLGLSPGAIHGLTLGYDVSNLSAWYCLREDRLLGDQWWRVRGGSHELVRGLQKLLNPHVRVITGAVVTRLERRHDGATVVWREGASEGKLTADRVICTFPFSTLRHVEVTPDWSPPKRYAIDELVYDSVVRMYFETSHRFWNEKGLDGFAETDDPASIWDMTWDQKGPGGVLMLY
ncbi:MAG: flavin monoamine oxidase family protein, partial [Candidatus Xenobia bacterium]